MEDLISRQAALDAMYELCDTGGTLKENPWRDNPHIDAVVETIEELPSVNPQQKTKWIPVKWHYITDEEREREGYPKEWVYHIDCVMPEDGEEILITVRGRVEKDICYIDDGFYLDSGYDWLEDIEAWCELPEPYEPQESEG